MGVDPRNDRADRMVGGVFQGANQANFSDAVVLHTVTAPPTQERYQLIAVTTAQKFRFLRYRSPDDSWGNIGEVRFYGPAKPGALKSRRNAVSAAFE